MPPIGDTPCAHQWVPYDIVAQGVDNRTKSVICVNCGQLRPLPEANHIRVAAGNTYVRGPYYPRGYSFACGHCHESYDCCWPTAEEADRAWELHRQSERHRRPCKEEANHD